MTYIHNSPIGGGFIAGTLVEAETGLTPIECIAIGDCVLTIDPRSDQREYAPVLNVIKHVAQPIVALKYTDADPNACKSDDQVFHLFATINQVLFAQGGDWVGVKQLKSDQPIYLQQVQTGRHVQSWPVLRTPIAGLGWVSSDTLQLCYSLETSGHIVDFRQGCNLWQYSWRNKEENPMGALHFGGTNFYPPKAPFDGDDLESILQSAQPMLQVDAYTLEASGFHTYCVGQFGVLVHGALTPTEQCVRELIAVGRNAFAAHNHELAQSLMLRASAAAELLSDQPLVCEALLEECQVLQASRKYSEALVVARKAALIAHETKSIELLANAQLHVVETLILQQQLDAANKLLGEVLADARKQKDRRSECRALCLWAAINAQRAEFEACLIKAGAAIEIGLALGDQETIDRALRIRGQAFLELNMPAKALPAIESAYQSVKDYDPRQAALILAESARALTMLEREPEARLAISKALGLSQEAGAIMAEVLIASAEMFSQPAPRTSLFDAINAYRIAQESEQPSLAYRAKQSIARIAPRTRFYASPIPCDSPLIKVGQKAYSSCDYQFALTCFVDAQKQAETDGNHQLRAYAAIGASNCLRRLERAPDALVAANIALVASEQADSPALLAHARLVKGYAHWIAEDFDTAHAMYSAALEESKAAGIQALVAEALSALGDYLENRRNYDQAWVTYSQAFNEAIAATHLEAVVRIAIKQSRMCHLSHEWEKALDIADLACLLVTPLESPLTSAQARYIKGATLKRLNEFQDAAKEFEVALGDANKVGESSLRQTIENELQSCRDILKRWPRA